MRILVFSVLPLPLLDYLAEYLAGAGNDVIYLAGKRARSHSQAGVRRIIMNFAEGSHADDYAEAWKQAMKNGAFGLRALRNIASSWLPDIMLCRSGQGAAFFIRQAFPNAFMAAFAADSREAGITVELDSRLFLQSQLRYAPDKNSLAKFPPLLRDAIQLEPVCVDADFFRPGAGAPFSCWKLASGAGDAIGVVLTGLAADALRAWLDALVDALAKDRKLAIVALIDSRQNSARLVRALEAMPRELNGRIYVANHFEKDVWRNLCASVPVIFTGETQAMQALECVAAGGSAWIAGDSNLEDVPGVLRLPPDLPIKICLRKSRLRQPDRKAMQTVRRDYDRARVVPDLAARILSEYARQSANISPSATLSGQ